MAKGPFASSGNQAAEIQAAPQFGGASQSSAIAEGVSKIANVVIPVVRENKINEVKDDINQQTSSVRDFLKLARNPELLTSEFGVDAVENPAVRQALSDFVDIREQSEQGILPSKFALERLEVIQNDAIAQAPEFAQEIRMAMVAATGQDPAKTLFAQLLRPPSAAEKTPEQKADEAIRFEARKNGVPVEAVIAAGRAEMENGFAQDSFQIKKRNGVEQLQDISASANLHASTLHGRILQAVNLAVNSPEGLTSDFATQLKTQIRLDTMSAEQAVVSGLSGKYSDKDLTDSLGSLFRWRDNMFAIIDDNQLGALVANKTAMMQTLITGEFMKSPSSAAALTIGGPQMYAELEKLFAMKDNKQMQSLSKSLFPAQQQAADAANIGGRAFAPQNRGTTFGMPSKLQVIDQFTQMGDGNLDNLNAKDKTARRIAANLTLRTPGVKGPAMENAVADLDDDFGWRAIQNTKVVASAKAHPVLARRVNVLVGNQIAALAFEYTNSLTGLTGFNADNLEMQGNTLVYTPTFKQGAEATDADRAVPAFVQRFNVAASVAQRYSRVGVLDATKFTTSDAFFNTIKTATEQQQKEVLKPKPSGTEFVRDSNGNIVLKRG